MEDLRHADDPFSANWDIGNTRQHGTKRGMYTHSTMVITAKFNLFLRLATLLLIGLPSTTFASDEITDLPYSCEQKLSNYSRNELEKLKLEAEISISNLPELKNLASSIIKNKDSISLNKKGLRKQSTY